MKIQNLVLSFFSDCSCKTLQLSLSNGALLEHGDLEDKYKHKPFLIESSTSMRLPRWTTQKIAWQKGGSVQKQ